MLFKSRFLEGLADGTITLAFRRWKRPTVRPGGRLRTPIGVLSIEAVEVVTEPDITERDARRAGFPSRGELLDELNAHEGTIYRIELRFAGADPRAALRQKDALTDEELTEVQRRLARLDAASRSGPWTKTVLRLIADNPARRAGDLAALLDRETQPFKLDVRKLKELGLTESLEVGYRLSPRGRVVLGRLEK